MKKLYESLCRQGVDVQADHPLAPHSSFRVGGKARLVAFPNTVEKLVATLREAVDANIRYAVFGNASNVVFSDDGFDGLVIFTGACKDIQIVGQTITAACGTPLWRVAALACENGLCGAEFMHGIPGTVGGGVYMNAGAFEGCMAQICTRTTYWDRQTGEIGCFEGEAHAFDTRTSVYAKSDRYILLQAEFLLPKGTRAEIRARMDDFMARRKRTQPLEYPSAGSVFKRPVGYFAGKLIQDCNLKGHTVGGAQVSQKHAGFIINIGNATAKDIAALTAYVRDTVLAQTGVLLECEIQFIEP